MEPYRDKAVGGHSFSQIWQATQRSVPRGSSSSVGHKEGEIAVVLGQRGLTSGYCCVTYRAGSWKLPARFFAVTARPLSDAGAEHGWAQRSTSPRTMSTLPRMTTASAIGVPEAHVLEDREVDEGRRPHAVSVGVGPAVADEIKADLALGPLDASVGLARLRAESPQLGLRVHDRAAGNVAQRLAQDPDRLPHLEDAHHVPVVGVAVVAQRHPESEAGIDAVAVDFAQVVGHPGRPQHGAGHPGADRKVGRQPPDPLGARHQDLVAGEQRLQFVQEGAVAVDERAGRREPSRVGSTRQPPNRW